MTRTEGRPYAPVAGERDPLLWGFRDTRFEFVGDRAVRVTGNRYPIAGVPMPRFVPFVESMLGVPLGPDRMQERRSPPPLPTALPVDAVRAELEGVVDDRQWADDDAARLAHSHGQLSVEEVYRILNGGVPERVVDAVVFPEDAEQVARLVRAADRHEVVLIPYGGGTNVSGALLCPPDERRPIVSVDLRRMDRILELNPNDGRVVVQAGITGLELEARLEERGLTCGHVPDSVELSTVGGWIATHASGMKKNRYGNIEDVVLSATLVTPRGEVASVPVVPRTSLGVQPRGFLFGAEGGLGIVTTAVLRVRPLPEARRYASFVFPDLPTGIRFLRDVQASGARPASFRLVGNTEFRLGQAIGPAHEGLAAWSSRLKRWYVTRLRRFDPMRMVACTAVMEGSAAEVRRQRADLHRILKRHGGLSGGAESGRRGYSLTFAIAYIRDFLNRQGVLGETFETSAPWSRIEAITGAVERELHAQAERAGVPGRPYLSYRVSQTYDAGVCIYFTMGFCGRGLEDPIGTYQRIEHRLREVVLEQGGSLSHHHGVGKIRRDFVGRVHTPAAIHAIRALKRSLDPNDVFAAGNHAFGPPGSEGPGMRDAGAESAREER